MKLLLVDWWSDVVNKVLLGQGLVEVKVKVCKGRLPFSLFSILVFCSCIFLALILIFKNTA